MTLDELAEDLHELDDDDNGCCLHIAVTDYNLTDGNLGSCEQYAREAGHARCLSLAIEFRQRVPEDHREAFLGVWLEEDANGRGSTVHPLDTPWRG